MRHINPFRAYVNRIFDSSHVLLLWASCAQNLIHKMLKIDFNTVMLHLHVKSYTCTVCLIMCSTFQRFLNVALLSLFL